MAKYLLARQLSGKRVVTNDGEEFGRVIDININELSGKIEELIVEPNPDNMLAERMRKEDGNVLVPYETVMAIGDYVIIEKRAIMS